MNFHHSLNVLCFDIQIIFMICRQIKKQIERAGKARPLPPAFVSSNHLNNVL